MAEAFWKTEAGWVLWRLDDGDLLVFNVQTRMARIIEDEDEARRVKDQMLADGISVVDEMPPA